VLKLQKVHVGLGVLTSSSDPPTFDKNVTPLIGLRSLLGAYLGSIRVNIHAVFELSKKELRVSGEARPGVRTDSQCNCLSYLVVPRVSWEFNPYMFWEFNPYMSWEFNPSIPRQFKYRHRGLFPVLLCRAILIFPPTEGQAQ